MSINKKSNKESYRCVGGSWEMMCFFTSLSKHFIMMRVRATVECCDLRFYFGTGIMVAVQKHDGTMAWSSEVLKMSVRTQTSCSAHSFRAHPGMLSGAWCLPCVDPLQSLPHISCIQMECPFILVGDSQECHLEPQTSQRRCLSRSGRPHLFFLLVGGCLVV